MTVYGHAYIYNSLKLLLTTHGAGIGLVGLAKKGDSGPILGMRRMRSYLQDTPKTTKMIRSFSGQPCFW